MIIWYNVIKYSKEQIRDYQIIAFMSRISSFIFNYFVDNLFNSCNSQKSEKKRDVKMIMKMNQVVINHLRTFCHFESYVFNKWRFECF